MKLVETHRMSHQLENLKLRRLLPRPLLEKEKEYRNRIHHILEQVGVVQSDNLLKLCTELLDEVYKLVPDTRRHFGKKQNHLL